MWKILGVPALALAIAAPAFAQPQYAQPPYAQPPYAQPQYPQRQYDQRQYDQQFAPPPGPYQSQCSNIRMNGHFLTAWCRGTRGSGESSINIESCSTPIGVDPSGGLSCIGPGGGAPPAVRDAPPGYYTGEQPAYGRPGDDGRYADGARRRDQPMATLYEGPGYRGRPVRLYGPMPDLNRTGLNDRVRSIQVDRRSGPWLVCSEANYGGRCVTVRRSVPDTRVFGMSDSISSVRPAW